MKFITTTQRNRKAVSPVIATLLLIAIAVAAAIIVYAFVTGLIGGLTGGSSGLIVESGTLSIPTGVASPAAPGSLVVTIKNSGSAPIKSVVLTETSDTAVCDTGAAPCTPSWSAAAPFTWTALAAGDIPTGQTQSFSTPITGGDAGTSYTYTVTITFTTGTSNNIQSLPLVAQT